MSRAKRIRISRMRSKRAKRELAFLKALDKLERGISDYQRGMAELQYKMAVAAIPRPR